MRLQDFPRFRGEIPIYSWLSNVFSYVFHNVSPIGRPFCPHIALQVSQHSPGPQQDPWRERAGEQLRRVTLRSPLPDIRSPCPLVLTRTANAEAMAHFDWQISILSGSHLKLSWFTHGFSPFSHGFFQGFSRPGPGALCVFQVPSP